MNIRKSLLAASFLIMAVAGSAQTTTSGWMAAPEVNKDSLVEAIKNSYRKPVRYCLSYEDFQNNRWITGDTVRMVDRKESNLFADQCVNVKFLTDDKSYEKLLQKECFAVLHNDSLYFNCKAVKDLGGMSYSKGYVKAYRYGKKGLCIPTEPLHTNLDNNTVFAYGFMFGLAGSAFVLAATESGKHIDAVFVLSDDGNQLTKVKDGYMLHLLSGHQELLDRYKHQKKANRTTSKNVMGFFRDLGLVK